MFGHKMRAGCWMSQPLLLLQHQARMSQQEATQQHSSKSGSHSFKGECHSYSEGSIPSEWYQDLAAKRGRRGDYKLDAINNQRIFGDRKHREVTVLWRNCLVMGCSPVALTHCRAGGAAQDSQHRALGKLSWKTTLTCTDLPHPGTKGFASLRGTSVLGSANCFAARRKARIIYSSMQTSAGTTLSYICSGRPLMADIFSPRTLCHKNLLYQLT